MSKQDAILMQKLAIILNSNLAAYWLKLRQYEGAKFHYDLALRFYKTNVKVRYQKALALVKMGLMDNAKLDLEITLKIELGNSVVLKKSQQLQDAFGATE